MCCQKYEVTQLTKDTEIRSDRIHQIQVQLETLYQEVQTYSQNCQV
ncbi:hypothetical protein IQ238_13630 [Pleurocapsales cyanobacterium LEGE 06147]|nr:hypothetical protein [Pleurocapsales cyanobacterium LEGE 06147]